MDRWNQIKPQYDSSTNYLLQVIQYEYDKDYKKKGKPYEYVESIFKEMTNTLEKQGKDKNKYFYEWIVGYAYEEFKRKEQKSVIEQMRDNLKNINKKVKYQWITIGWNDEKISIEKMKELSNKFSKLAIFSKCKVKYVLEKHRDNGIHHHTHFLLVSESVVSFSQILQQTFRISTMSDYTKENFVDIKQSWRTKNMAPLETYENYLIGNKKEEKMTFVQEDDHWRASNDIMRLYS